MADLQKNYVAEGAPHLCLLRNNEYGEDGHSPNIQHLTFVLLRSSRSIKAINVDLEALDKDYTILSDHMAKGERDNFNEA